VCGSRPPGGRPDGWSGRNLDGYRYASRVAHAADEPDLEPVSADDRREVALVEELEILPDQTTDDTDAGWGERGRSNDDHLLAERPPHWG
jgi:hypothetical protein